MGTVSILDIILIVFILIIAFAGARKGFFHVVINCASYIAAVFISRMAATPVSHLIYNTIFKQKMTEHISSVLPDGNDIILTITQALPENAAKIANYFNFIPDGEAANAISSALSPEKIESTYVMPIVTKIILIVTTVVLFVILSVILRFVAGAINRILFKKKKNIAAFLNKLLGFVFGAVKAIIPTAVICEIFNLTAPLTGNSFFADAVVNSRLCSFVAGLIK